jgi:hypothetical protein
MIKPGFFGSSPRVASCPRLQDSRRDVVRSVKLINVNAGEFALNCHVKYLHCSIFCWRTFRQIDDEGGNVVGVVCHRGYFPHCARSSLRTIKNESES